MVIGDAFSSPANNRNGKMAWKMSRILAAESASILIFRLTSLLHGKVGANVNSELPIKQPVVSALVASASQRTQEACCAFRPIQVQPLPQPLRRTETGKSHTTAPAPLRRPIAAHVMDMNRNPGQGREPHGNSHELAPAFARSAVQLHHLWLGFVLHGCVRLGEYGRRGFRSRTDIWKEGMGGSHAWNCLAAQNI